MKTLLFTVMSFIAITSYANCGTASEVDANAPLSVVALTDGRNVLAADQGLTVYIFDVDTTSESQCYDSCEKAWPPVLVPAGAVLGANMGTTVRKDGSQQLTHNGRPIYFYIGDGAQGEINGDGLGGVWHIITL